MEFKSDKKLIETILENFSDNKKDAFKESEDNNRLHLFFVYETVCGLLKEVAHKDLNCLAGEFFQVVFDCFLQKGICLSLNGSFKPL